MRGLLARRGTGVRAVAAGWSRRWALGCACWGQPCATAAGCGRGACVLLRDVPVTCRAWGSVSRALGPIDVCRAEPSISSAAQRPAGGASFRPRPRRGSSSTRPPGDLPERAASRIRALLRRRAPHREEGVALQRGDDQTPCDRRSKRPAAGAAANRAGRTFHHRGLRFAPPLQLNASQPWARTSHPSPPPRRSPFRA